MHPLKLVSLIAWACLLLAQLALLLPAYEISLYWSLPLVVLLLIPIRGLVLGRRYTYKWIGFLTLLYFCVGISELMTNPALRIYGFVTTLASLALFMASIYHARYLGLRQRD